MQIWVATQYLQTPGVCDRNTSKNEEFRLYAARSPLEMQKVHVTATKIQTDPNVH